MERKTVRGKTKEVRPIDAAVIETFNDITAGDGKKHDVLEGKAELATRTTCNVFRFLKQHAGVGLPIAFLAQLRPTKFLALYCSMVPIEIVVRREAHGSYLKRNPSVAKGTRFESPIVEMYLKTKDRSFRKHFDFPCDDPMMFICGSDAHLFEPSKPLVLEEPFRVIPVDDVFEPWDWSHSALHTYAWMAVRPFLILERAWAKLGRTLVDYKVEMGIAGPEWLAQPVLADVIDNDSWRLLSPEGSYEDKQGYRDGDGLAKVLENYRRVADLTDTFEPLTPTDLAEIRRLDDIFEQGYYLPR
jgi:phosphoribosylaminoimidazole-succinocarboxamide synthase